MSSKLTSRKRLYTELMEQARSKVKNINQYVFSVSSEGLTDYQDWVVARINFSESNDESRKSRIIFTIDIYHFRDGFLRVDVEAKIDELNKKINIKFLLSKADVDIKGLDENAGDDFLINVIERLVNGFDKKKFKLGEKDYFELVSSVKWIPQMNILKQQQVYKERSKGAIVIIAVACVSLGILAYCISKKVWLSLKVVK